MVKPVRAVLMLIALAAPPSSSRVTSAAVGTDSSAMNGTSALLDQPPSPEHVVGGTQFLGEQQVEVGHLRRARTDSDGGPAAVAVDVQLDRVTESLAQRAARPRCPASRVGGRP